MAFADDLKTAVDRALRIVKLERPAMTQVAEDQNAFVPAIAIVAIAGVAHGIGAILKTPLAVVAAPVGALIASFLLVGLIYVVGLLFKPPSWDFLQLYRTLGHSYLLQWVGIVGIIPFLGQLVMVVAGLYSLVVWVVTIETVGKLDRTKAILIVAIPMALCCAVAVLAFGAALLAALGLGSMAGGMGR